MLKKICLTLLLICSKIAASEIAIVTLIVGDRYSDAVKAGIENKEAYCKKHGYDFFCSTEVLDPSRPIPWSKIVLIQKTMENYSYKWVFWTDADALIMNMEIPLENLIDENFNFIVSKESYFVNTGNFLIRNCPWSKKFLERVYAHEDCISHKWWEQAAIFKELKYNSESLEKTKILPQRTFCAFHKGYSQEVVYQPGDFILHFAGVRNLEELKNLMEFYAEQAKR